MKQLDQKLGLSPAKTVDIITKNETPDLVKISHEGEIDLTAEEQKLQQEFDEDFFRVKTNLYDAISVAKSSLLEIGAIAQETESPKAYDSVNSLLKTIIDASKTLLDSHAEKRKSRTRINKVNMIKNETSAPTTIQNAIFTGTPKDLQKFLKELKKEEDNEI